MILCVLDIVFLQLHAQLLLIGTFSLQLLRILREGIVCVPKDLFVGSLLLKFSLVVTVHLVKLLFVFLGDLGNEHSVVGAAAVLE